MELLIPILKEVKSWPDGGELRRQFYLTDVNSFVAPVAVVPDMSDKDEHKLRYFQVRPRAEWAKLFGKWLEATFEGELEEIKTEEDKKTPPVPLPKKLTKKERDTKRKKTDEQEEKK